MTYSMAKKTSSILMGGVAFVVASPAYADVSYCPPYGLMEQPRLDVERGFFPFTISVDDLPLGRKQVRLTGDVIKIDRPTLGTLIRAASRFDPRIAKVVIDARIVEFRDTLSFKNADVTILADRVVFQPSGAVSLLAESSGSLEIVARSLELAGGRSRPFDFRSAAKPDGSISFPQGVSLLRVTAEALSIGGVKVDPAAAPPKLADRFTLSRLIDFQPLIQSDLGQSGQEAWERRTVSEAQWPDYSTAVWLTALRLNPFLPDTQAYLRRQIATYEPLLARLPDGSPARYRIANLKLALERNTDLQGNGAAWATSLPLSKLLDRINGYADATGEGRKRLNDLIAMLTSARDGAAPDTTSMEREAESQLRNAVTAYEAANTRLGEISTALSEEKASIDRQTQLYADRQQRLKGHAEDLERGQQSRAQLLSAISTAASIATTAYTGNPALGSAAGGIIYAVGNAKMGKPVIDSLSAGWQFANAIKGPLEASSKAAASLKQGREQYASFIDSFTLGNITIKKEIEVPVEKPDPGKPKTKKVIRSEALNDMGTRGEALGKSIQGLYDVYTKFVPETAKIPAALEEDQSLKQHAMDIQVSLERVKALTIELDTLQRTGQEQQQTIATASERLVALRSIDPTNEESRRAAVQYVISAARDELASFADAMLDLRRLSLVEYAEPLPVDLGQLQRVLVFEETTPNWDPALGLSERDAETAYIDLLQRRRDAIQILAVRASQAAVSQFRNYVTRRGVQPIISYPQQEITDSRRSPRDERRFIALLNEDIQAQYALIKKHGPDLEEQLNALRDRRIQVPFDIKEALRARYPVRLIRAAVTGLKHEGVVSGGDISFTLEVERVGNYRHPMVRQRSGGSGEICFSVDLRAKESQPRQYYTPADFTVGDISAGLTLPRSPAVSFWYLTSADSQPDQGRTMFVTYPPAEARMYISVRLDSRAAWARAPVVTSLTVKAEVFE